MLNGRIPLESDDGGGDESFLLLFEQGDFAGAKAMLERGPELFQHAGCQAHPILRQFINRNDGHCYKRSHLQIADLLIPARVRAFRAAVFGDHLQQVLEQH